MLRAEQAALLGGERDEHEAAALPIGDFCEAPGQFHDRRGARRVIVSTVVDLFLALVFGEAAGSAVAEVIVVSADDNRLLCERAGPFQNSDDVLDRRGLAADFGFDARGPTLERGAVRFEVAV